MPGMNSFPEKLPMSMDMLIDMLIDNDIDMLADKKSNTLKERMSGSTPKGLLKPKASLGRLASVFTANLFRSREAEATPQAKRKYDTTNFILSYIYLCMRERERQLM
mmetsp:Transcript_52873/g.78822  ORF Transcript_52873/g.78822 Transcript_52873/m.78822 type:complete len:107 (-) Transcript_52873:63-383(-)